ncbi:SusF/SusE family outer membrane protein [Lutibacter sp.]|uniref:SusF/SusE family outer membrane protein n=1 Tax=Lutibacter sp. TaxID=1925666 RepID=UPI002734C989|nr:SusF/SusE family outer membrane protein [Lutibacter sp.]MDP3312462.1 SusF/SusE family outer membrane protein [Lutibacter sp.]
MKYIYKLVLLSLVIVGFVSCDANENFEILDPIEGITINSPIDGSSIALNSTNKANPGLTVSWTSPTLEGTGVNYNVVVALTGTDFASPVTIGTTNKTSISLTVVQLNTLAIDLLKIPGDTEAGIEIRVVSGEVISNKVSVLLTPFKVEYVKFFLVGSLTNWKPEESLPMTRIAFNEFKITVDLPAGAEFKFLPQNTGWDGDFGEDKTKPGKLVEKDEKNISGYAAGKYEIYVNLNTFTFTVTKIVAPNSLYLVGSLTGWDPGTSIPFNKTGENIFSIVINLPAGGEFKFLPQNTSWDGDWGASKTTSGGIVQTDEDNVKGFDAGKYIVTVDFNTLKFKLTAVNNLFVVGSINGWNNSAALPMGEASLGIYSTVLDLPSGAEFKFLPTNGSWDGDWGASKTATGRIVQDDEDNLKGYEAGKYVVAVNFNTLTFTVSKITIPTNLYLVGGFNGWSNTTGNPQFTQVSAGVFEITQTLGANDEFKFVPVAGSWDNDYGTSKTSKNVLEQNSEDNLKVSNAGTYKITVNFNKGTISYVKI